MSSQNKIKSTVQAQQQVSTWQQAGEQVVFTNGCFDIVHLGHIDYLEKARAKGHRLVLGLNTDASVSRLKGPTRPLVNQYARARMMAALQFVDLVVLFDQETPLELIETLKPNVLVKGNDYTIQTIVGADFVLQNGGRVETIELVPGYSTTAMVAKIKNMQ
jgi:D-glycero-beta-D-manno-heptose 1-phosphate adenylyltransferase